VRQAAGAVLQVALQEAVASGLVALLPIGQAAAAAAGGQQLPACEQVLLLSNAGVQPVYVCDGSRALCLPAWGYLVEPAAAVGDPAIAGAEPLSVAQLSNAAAAGRCLFAAVPQQQE
jgi:hypothetical protein